MARARPEGPPYRRGMRLGKYRLDRFLGAGSFSQVWRAYDLIENHPVAIKIAHPVHANSEAEAELLREIRLGVQLEHPNILRVRNADKMGRVYFLVTALANESLEQRLRRRLSTRRAVWYFEQLLRGLAYAHEQHIVHRDVKPSNVLLFPDDVVRIGDFGLARFTRRTQFTGTGSGTLPYIAPEQAHGQPRFSSDVFSAGLVGFEMLTGQLPTWPFEWPFPGAPTLRQKVPSELIGVFRKACQPDYRERYADAVAMLHAFERTKPALQRMVTPAALTAEKRRERLKAWRALRHRDFENRFGERLFLNFSCPSCRGPVSEHMSACPWCGEADIAFGERSDFPYYCERCTRGMREEWRYCPWCWGPAYAPSAGPVRPDERYRFHCKKCRRPMMEGMLYCPWCHAKETRPVLIEGLEGRCWSCHSSVSADYWTVCPWCMAEL